MKEQDLKHGVISKGKIRRKIRRALRPTLAGAAPVTTSVTNKVTIRKNQFQADSCGGDAGANFLINDNLLKTGIETDISEKSIYALISYPGGGTTVYSLEDQLANKGANLQTDVPSLKSDGTTDEPFASDKSWVTPLLLQKALVNAGKTAVSVPINFDSMASAIQDAGGIIIEVEALNNGTWLSAYPKPPLKGQVPAWAHFVFAGGFNVENRTIDFINSWGTTVGENGVQHFTEEYINSGYIADCFTFYPKSIVEGGQVDTGSWLYRIYQKILHYFFT